MPFQLIFKVNIFLGIFLGICSTVCLNTGRGIQRLGADALGKNVLKRYKEEKSDRKKLNRWLIGTVIITIASVLQFAAQIFLDRPSTFVALGGIGIISVVLFAFFIIREKVTSLQVIGITTMIIGTILLGIDYPELVDKPLPNYSFFIYSAIFIILGILMLIIYKITKKGLGIIFGSISGFFNGFAAIATAFATATGENDIGASLLNGWFLLSLIVGQGAFWTTQYAFKLGGKASVVVPAMNAFIIVIPLILDGLIYQIPFGIFQILAFILNITGILVLSIASANVFNKVLIDAETVVEKQDKHELEKIE